MRRKEHFNVCLQYSATVCYGSASLDHTVWTFNTLKIVCFHAYSPVYEQIPKKSSGSFKVIH